MVRCFVIAIKIAEAQVYLIKDSEEKGQGSKYFWVRADHRPWRNSKVPVTRAETLQRREW